MDFQVASHIKNNNLAIPFLKKIQKRIKWKQKKRKKCLFWALCMLRVSYFFPNPQNNISEKIINFCYPRHKRVKCIWKKHPNNVKQKSKKDEIENKTHTTSLLICLFLDYHIFLFYKIFIYI